MIAIAAFALLAAVVALDLWLDRVVTRTLFKALDRLPPFRPGGRYRSSSMTERYEALKKDRCR